MNLLTYAYLAPLHAGVSTDISEWLFDEPLVFAAHYAAVAQHLERVTWPDTLAEKRNTLRERYGAHDAVLELMETLRGQVPMALSIELAQRLAIGLELHRAMTRERDTYRTLCSKVLSLVKPLSDRFEENTTNSGGRLAILCRLLGLNQTESRVLGLVLASSVDTGINLFLRLAHGNHNARAMLWPVLLGIPYHDLAKALSPTSRLIGSGLLHKREQMLRLSDFWVEFLVRGQGELISDLMRPLIVRDTGGVARLPDDDRNILIALLTKSEPGINVLLFGKPSVDKVRLAHTLVDAIGGDAYALNEDIPDEDRPAAIRIGQHLMQECPGRPILVVEEAGTILTRTLSPALALFGLNDDDTRRSLDEYLLEENPVATLWLTHEAQRLHRKTLALFLFHAEALKGSRADRQAMLESFITQLPLSEKEKMELAQLEGLSMSQLLAAKTLAQMTAGESCEAFARHFRIAVQRSQKALDKRGKDALRRPVTTYSLDYIHAAGRFGPLQILQALERNPRGSLCLYGLPGTGKTQFAETLSLRLGKPLLAKRASELFDKYVGESEKRIAEAFDQAEEEGAILLLDEADSFLQDRTRNRQVWEVSTVNELLQHMEHFEEILICTTNLYQQLDAAALRRFTFKLEFLPLSLDQRWAMFLNETGLAGKANNGNKAIKRSANHALSEKRRSGYEERLAFMKDLTPGDFATVKRQCLLLGENLSPEEWLDQLELEVKAKLRAGTEDQAVRGNG